MVNASVDHISESIFGVHTKRSFTDPKKQSDAFSGSRYAKFWLILAIGPALTSNSIPPSVIDIAPDFRILSTPAFPDGGRLVPVSPGSWSGSWKKSKLSWSYEVHTLSTAIRESCSISTTSSSPVSVLIVDCLCTTSGENGSSTSS
jgi:hypothetical protein